VAEHERGIHFQHLALDDPVPAGDGFANQLEVIADLSAEAFRPPAAASGGPQRDELGIGERVPELLD